MSYNVTFNVKDTNDNILGAAIDVDEFTDAELGAGTLDDVEVEKETLRLVTTGVQTDDTYNTNNTSSGSYDYAGNDITPKQNINLVKVKVKVRTDGEKTLYIRKGHSKTGELLHTQTVNTSVGQGNWYEFTIDPYLVLEEGEAYHIGWDRPSAIFYFGSGFLYDGTIWECNLARYNGSSSNHTLAMGLVHEAVEEAGNRISPATSLNAYGATEPDLRIKWRETVPENTTLTVETAITDSDTVNPGEGDWEAQTSGELISNLPADLTGKYLYTRVKMTSVGIVTPGLDWLVVWDDDGSSIPYAAARVDFNDEIKAADDTGEAVFEGVDAGEDQPYTVYVMMLNTPHWTPYETAGTVTVVDQNVTENVAVAIAEARLTNIGLQADVFMGPVITRITNIGLQVELGEYYSLAQPIRTRPRAAAARVLPRSPASRVGTEPPYGRA